MNTTCKSRLSQFWNHLQHELFPFLQEEDHLALSPALEKVIRVLEFTQVDRFIPSSRGFVGRPPQERVALARAFVAKAVLDLPTTEALIDRLKADLRLRAVSRDPSASRFSRVFAEFSALELPARVHEALIRAQLGDQIIGHIARDSTEIEAREKPTPKAAAVAPTAPSGLFDGVAVDGAPAVASADPVPAPAKKRGRPRQGEERHQEPTVIERQVDQSVAKSLAQLPTACDVGSKKNSKGFKETWTGYKLPYRHRGRRHPGDGDTDLGLAA